MFRIVNGREVDIATLGQGAVFGEMSLVDGKPRSASVKALDDCAVHIVDADAFHSKIRGVPPWFMTLVRMVSQKIRGANKHLERVQFDQRGINIILGLEYFFLRERSTTLKLATTHKELCQLLNVTQQKMFCILDFLQKHGLITIGSDEIACNDESDFHDYCTFLRRVARKTYDSLETVSEPLKKVLMTIAQHVKVGENVDPTPLTEVELRNIFTQADPEQDKQELANSLRSLKILTKGIGSGPASSSALYIKGTVLHNFILYFKYAKVLPCP